MFLRIELFETIITKKKKLGKASLQSTTELLFSEYEVIEMFHKSKLTDFKNRNKCFTLYSTTAETINNIINGCIAIDERKENQKVCHFFNKKINSFY